MKIKIEAIARQILHNFWLKMVALALAVLTWLYIVGELFNK
jgi:hypothetical protein